MINDRELEWKVIAINSADPLASQLHDIHDVETHCKGTISGIREWFRWYKTPDDKPLNEFGFDEVALNKKFAEKVIADTHLFWGDLVEGNTDSGRLWWP
jgi:inorganic pyrophosphatase